MPGSPRNKTQTHRIIIKFCGTVYFSLPNLSIVMLFLYDSPAKVYHFFQAGLLSLKLHFWKNNPSAEAGTTIS